MVAGYILYQKGYIFKNYQDISIQDSYQQLQNDSNITLLDVRTIKEIKTDGKISNSILIPVQILQRNIDKLEKYKSTKIFVYCRSGNRSITASRILANHGYHPYNINGGINTWKSKKLPVE
jgi:rhodanese-related sulfurtransferase